MCMGCGCGCGWLATHSSPISKSWPSMATSSGWSQGAENCSCLFGSYTTPHPAQTGTKRGVLLSRRRVQNCRDVGGGGGRTLRSRRKSRSQSWPVPTRWPLIQMRKAWFRVQILIDAVDWLPLASSAENWPMSEARPSYAAQSTRARVNTSENARAACRPKRSESLRIIQQVSVELLGGWALALP